MVCSPPRGVTRRTTFTVTFYDPKDDHIAPPPLVFSLKDAKPHSSIWTIGCKRWKLGSLVDTLLAKESYAFPGMPAQSNIRIVSYVFVFRFQLHNLQLNNTTSLPPLCFVQGGRRRQQKERKSGSKQVEPLELDSEGVPPSKVRIRILPQNNGSNCQLLRSSVSNQHFPRNNESDTV